MGPKIDCGSNNNPDSDNELDLTRIDNEVRVLHGQLLTQLSDSLLDAPMDSLGVVGETERLEDLTLGSDEEREINSIPGPSKAKETGPSTSATTHSQSSSESEAEKTLVRQDAVGTDDEATVPVSRTKKDKAIWSVRKSVDFLNKIATSDPALLDKRGKLIIKKNRKNIHKFERTYGPIAKILGLAYPVGFRGKVDEGSDNAPQGEESSSTLETNVKGKGTAQASKPGEPAASQVKSGSAAPKAGNKGCSDQSSKPSCSKQATAGGAKKDVSASNPKKSEEKAAPSKANTLKTPLKGTPKKDSTGKEQNSKPTTADRQQGGNPKDKKVVKRARSGDDQQKPKAKKASQTSGGSHKDTKSVVRRTQSEDDKPSTSKKAREASKSGSIQAAVINRNDPDGRITTEMWRLKSFRLGIGLMKLHSWVRIGTRESRLSVVAIRKHLNSLELQLAEVATYVQARNWM